MTDREHNVAEPAQLPPPSDGGSIMFWVLVGIAAAVFAPCVLLPAWRDYQALQYAEQVEQAGVEQARAELEQQKRNLAALQNDPSAIIRVARRELRYRDPEEIAIPVSIGAESQEEPAPVILKPVEPPSSVAWVIDKLPEADYDRLFCAGPTRTILMCLSGGLVLSAFAIYSPRRNAQVLNIEC